MHRLLVLYNEPKDPAHFRKHYVETHVPLARKLSGAKAILRTRPTSTPRYRTGALTFNPETDSVM